MKQLDRLIKLFLTGIVLSLSISLMAQNAPKLTKSNIKQVISAMTLEEKAKLVVGTGMNFQMPLERARGFSTYT